MGEQGGSSGASSLTSMREDLPWVSVVCFLNELTCPSESTCTRLKN